MSAGPLPTRERRPILAQAFTLPNIITYGRIAAIPLVLFMMQSDSRRNAFAAAIVFALASATDAVDGYLARKFNQISLIGKILDPLADKLIVMAVLLALLDLGRAPLWAVLVLFARDVLINALRTIAAAEGMELAARDLGKLKTAFQMVGVWALLIHYPYAFPVFPDAIDFHRIGIYLLYVSVVLSLVSALDYMASFARAAGEAK